MEWHFAKRIILNHQTISSPFLEFPDGNNYIIGLWDLFWFFILTSLKINYWKNWSVKLYMTSSSNRLTESLAIFTLIAFLVLFICPIFNLHSTIYNCLKKLFQPQTWKCFRKCDKSTEYDPIHNTLNSNLL